MDFYIEVNNKQIIAREGETLLSALRSHGIKVPTLCHMNRFSPTGACRLCVVEVEGKRDLITSCSYPVEKGMRVKTNSRRVIQARKTLVELLISNHPDDCLYCQRNGNCELQWLAAEMNVKERKYFGNKNAHKPDYSSSSVARDPAKCVLCSRCVRMCEEVQLVTAIDFISRANQTMVNSAFNKGLNVSSCIHCGQCIQVCPTAALTDISHIEKVNAALNNKNKEVMFLLSPSAIASMAVVMGVKPKDDPAGLIVAALKRCGASKVFDLGVACDINLLEEAKILADKIKHDDAQSQPLISSCCPAWVRYVEEFRREYMKQLAQNKSPQQLMGALLKVHHAANEKQDMEKIFSVAVMPCVAKKYESSREENTHKGVSEIDAVLTVRELTQLLRSYGLDINQMVAESFDKPFNRSSAAAIELAYSGGKAEAVARELHRMLGGKPGEFKFIVPKTLAGKRESKINIGDRQIGFAWVSSIRDAESYLQQLKEEKRNDIHYVEVMACLGGCAGGGGQPVSRGFEQNLARKKYCMDMKKLNEMDSANNNSLLSAFYNDDQLFIDMDGVEEWLQTKIKHQKG